MHVIHPVHDRRYVLLLKLLVPLVLLDDGHFCSTKKRTHHLTQQARPALFPVRPQKCLHHAAICFVHMHYRETWAPARSLRAPTVHSWHWTSVQRETEQTVNAARFFLNFMLRLILNICDKLICQSYRLRETDLCQALWPPQRGQSPVLWLQGGPLLLHHLLDDDGGPGVFLLAVFDLAVSLQQPGPAVF